MILSKKILICFKRTFAKFLRVWYDSKTMKIEVSYLFCLVHFLVSVIESRGVAQLG